MATIRYIDEHELPRNAAIVGGYLREKLEALKSAALDAAFATV